MQYLCRREDMTKIKNVKPLELVQEQFQLLKEKLKSTGDAREKTILLRRLANLVGVIHFLISINKNQ